MKAIMSKKRAMKAIMSMAHGIREAAAKTWGGKPGDYVLSIALEMAWTTHKNVLENKMERLIEWKTSKGLAASVRINLVTEKTTNADGDKITVPCCEMEIWAEVEGHGIIGSGKPWVRKGLPMGAVATIGKLAIQPEQLQQINAAIAEIEATPEWQAKVARIAKAEKESQEYEAHRAKMRKVMGY